MQRLFFLAVIILVLAACGSAGGAATLAQPGGQAVIAADSKLIGDAGQADIPEVGAVAPDFQYTMLDGTTHRLSELRGKKVLLNFWATWCAPCRIEMPDIQKALGERSEPVAVLGVNKAEAVDAIAAFAGEVKVGFPLIANPQGDIGSRYAAINLPTSYFINSDGTIGLRKTGVMDESFINNHLDQLK